jgi:hypothetical protein
MVTETPWRQAVFTEKIYGLRPVLIAPFQCISIIMNPEQLSSKSFEALQKDDDYLRRTYFLGVDEVHKAFRQIGFVRARFFRL